MKIAVFLIALLLLATNTKKKTDLEKNNLKGPVKSVTTYSFEGISNKEIEDYNDSIDNGMTTTTYDKQGYIKQTISQFRYAEGPGTQTRIEDYDYTDDYLKLTKKEYAANDSLVRSIQIVFNVLGNIHRSTEYTSDGELKEWSMYTYQEDQNEAYSTEYNSKGKVTGSWLFERNTSRDTLTSTKLRKNGKILHGHQWIYDEHGNAVFFVWFNKKHKVFSEIEYTYQSFDQKGNWTKMVAKHTTLDTKTLKWNKRANIPPTTYGIQIRSIEYYE